MAAGLMSLIPLSSGCSIAFVDGPPEHHETMRYFRCTDSEGFPYADASSALGAALYALQSKQLADNGLIDQSSANPAIFAGIATAVAFATSAIVGMSRVHECHAAEDDLEDRLLGNTTAQGPPRVAGTASFLPPKARH
jgi:hypothetical protein